MFIGREKEIEAVVDFLTSKGSMLIYGLRRVGKTSLIKHVLSSNNHKYIYFECIKASEEENVSLFVNLLKEQLGFVDASFLTFSSVFKLLNTQYPDYVVVIDEYSYLKQFYLESKKSGYKERAETLDSEFQNIIDEFSSNLNIILSGSSINIMKNLLEHRNPLYGRFKKVINLKQFNYLETKKLLNKLSNKDVIAFYSVFGGSPHVLTKIDQSKDLRTNITNLLLDEYGELKNHINSNVLSELDNDPELHDVLNAIKNGCKKYKEIEDKSHITTSGLLDKKLKKLISLDILEEYYPINYQHDKTKKYYRIKDNLLKFYYAYIFREENTISLLSKEKFYETKIEPSITTFISLRFENIVKDYFSIAFSKGMYKDYVDIGSYFTSNSEFDCVIKKKDKKYIVYEAKYYSNPIDEKIIQTELKQIQDIKGIDVDEIGFVSSSGYKSILKGIKYLELKDIFFE